MLFSETVQKAMPLVVYHETSNIGLAGLVFGITWLPRIILQPFMGVFIDTFSPRVSFIVADFGRALLSIVFFMNLSTLVILIGGSLFGLFSGLSFMASEKAISKHLGLDRTPSVQSSLQLAEQSALIIGPLLSGFFVAKNYILMGLLGSTVAFVLTAIMISFIYHNIPKIKNTNKNSMIIKNIMLGVVEIISNNKLMILALTTASINLIESLCLVAIPARIIGSLKYTESEVGMIMSFASAISLIALYSISKCNQTGNGKGLSRVGLVLIPMGAICFSISSSLFLCGLGYILLILGRVLYVIYMRIERAALINMQTFSTVMGVFLSVILLPVPAAGFIVLSTSQIVSVEALIIFITILFLILVLLYSSYRAFFLKLAKPFNQRLG